MDYADQKWKKKNFICKSISNAPSLLFDIRNIKTCNTQRSWSKRKKNINKTNHLIPAGRSDLVLINKKENLPSCGFWHSYRPQSENKRKWKDWQKIKSYQRTNNMTVMPIVVGTLRMVSKDLLSFNLHWKTTRCEKLMWKIQTAQIRAEIYDSLINRRLFPEKQKGCR